MLIVRGDFDQPPYAFVGADGEVAGFDVDLLRAVARAAGRDVAFEPADAVTALAPDLVLGACYGSPPDPDIARFCEPHSMRDHAVIVRRGSLYRGLADLTGRALVVPVASKARPWLESHGFGNALADAPSVAAALDILDAGDHEAAVCDRFEALEAMRDRGLGNLRLLPDSVFPMEYGFALLRDDAELAAALDEGLAVVRRTGQESRLREKWFANLAPAASPAFSLGAAYSILLWLILPGVLVVVAAVVHASGLRRRARLRIAALEEELAEAREAYRRLSVEQARQRYVINQLSTVSLVDQLLDASRQ